MGTADVGRALVGRTVVAHMEASGHIVVDNPVGHIVEGMMVCKVLLGNHVEDMDLVGRREVGTACFHSVHEALMVHVVVVHDHEDQAWS